MKKIAVFASGNGSNFQAIIDAIQAGKLDADMALLVCDQPGAFVIERAKAIRHSKLCLLTQKTIAARKHYEKEIIQSN